MGTLGVPALNALAQRRRLSEPTAFLLQSELVLAVGFHVFANSFLEALLLPPASALVALFWGLNLLAFNVGFAMFTFGAGLATLLAGAWLVDHLSERLRTWLLLPLLVGSLAAMIATAEWRAQALIQNEAARLGAQCTSARSFLDSLRRHHREGYRHPHATAMINDVAHSWSYAEGSFLPVPTEERTHGVFQRALRLCVQ